MIFNMVGGAGGKAGADITVVGGAVKPSSPKENTIWLNTSVSIPGWKLSSLQPPETAEGFVWVMCDVAGYIELMVDKKHNTVLYPTAVYQYTGGAWVPCRDAAIYCDNGSGLAWTPFRYYIINAGIPAFDLTKNAYCTWDYEQMAFHYRPNQNGGYRAYVQPSMPIDVTGFAKACVDILPDSKTNQPRMGLSDKASSAGDYMELPQDGSGYKDLIPGVQTWDISGFSGELFLYLSAYGNSSGTGHVYVRDLWLE